MVLDTLWIGSPGGSSPFSWSLLPISPFPLLPHPSFFSCPLLFLPSPTLYYLPLFFPLHSPFLPVLPFLSFSPFLSSISLISPFLPLSCTLLSFSFPLLSPFLAFLFSPSLLPSHSIMYHLHSPPLPIFFSCLFLPSITFSYIGGGESTLWPHANNRCFTSPCPHLHPSMFVIVLDIGYFYLAQNSIKVMIFLLLHPACWDYKHGATHPASSLSPLKKTLIKKTLHALDMS